MFGRLAVYFHLLQASRVESGIARAGKGRRAPARGRRSEEVGMLLRLASVVLPVLVAVSIVQWAAH